MKNTKIAISGIRGSFSEEALGEYLMQNNLEAEIIYSTTADGTFDTVMSGRADKGLVALENSNGGIVMETVYAMSKHVFKIEKIFEIDVQQNLLVKHETKKKDIKKITSHQQALAQCKMYLKRVWPEVLLSEYEDTALAAKDLASGKLSPDTAVIGSKKAAEIFRLDILEPSIQDLKFNFTSFLVFSK